MAVDWIVGQGDTRPAIAHQFRQDPAPGNRQGDPATLIDAVQVTAVIRHESNKATVYTAAATITSAPAGTVQVPLPTEATDNPGLYSIQWLVDWSDGSRSTYPMSTRSRSNWLLVRGGIVPDSVPVPPTTGNGSPPLLIADGATGQVTGNGQVVLAGAAATIDVLAGIRSFMVAEWSTQTAWATGTTPTITQTGVTVDPSVPARLAEARGDVVAVVSDGSTWVASVAVEDEEVGEGATLPADNSEWELFRLVGTPASDGLYSWSEDAATWIEA